MKADSNEIRKEIARRHLLHFTKHTMEKFEPQEFHLIYYEVLDLFAKGKIKKLMITMPPQHGKSEGSTRRLPSFMLGHNPDLKTAIVSYSSTFAKKFNREIQRIIDSQEYHLLFPETILNESNVVTISSNYLRNSEEFEIVNKKGSLKAVGRGGPLTGNPVDVLIMDDLYKDHSEGNSPITREAVWNWYVSTADTRLHNDSQQLIVFTRWHEDDLIGRIESNKSEKVVEIKSLKEIEKIDSSSWVKINFEALKESEPTEIDSREKGQALWEIKHSAKKLERSKGLDGENFNCLFQGNPESSSGKLYSPFKTYDNLPPLREKKNYTDTADKGEDFLFSCDYGLPLNTEDTNIYIIDCLYTDKPMEYTEKWTASQLKRNAIGLAEIESNNGGRGFARAVQKLVPPNIVVQDFTQSGNKESRILTNKAAVNSRIIFPSGWETRFPDLYKHLTGFKKVFKANKQDGGPDVLTGIIERNDGNDFWVI